MSSHVPRGTGRAGERGSSDAPHLGTVQGLLRGLLPVGHLTVRVRVREADRVLHGSRPAPEASSGVIATPYPRRERMSPVPRRSRRISPPRSTRRAIGPPLRRVGARTAQAPRTATTTPGPAGRTRPAGKAPAATPPPPPPPPPPIPGRRARGPEAAPTARSWRSWLELPQPQPNARSTRQREARTGTGHHARAHTNTHALRRCRSPARRGPGDGRKSRRCECCGRWRRAAPALGRRRDVRPPGAARGTSAQPDPPLRSRPSPRTLTARPAAVSHGPAPLPAPPTAVLPHKGRKGEKKPTPAVPAGVLTRVCAHHPTALDLKTLCTTAKHRGRFCTVRAGG